MELTFILGWIIAGIVLLVQGLRYNNPALSSLGAFVIVSWLAVMVAAARYRRRHLKPQPQRAGSNLEDTVSRSLTEPQSEHA